MISVIKLKRQVTNSDNISAIHNQQKIRIKIKLRTYLIQQEKGNNPIEKQANHVKNHFID